METDGNLLREIDEYLNALGEREEKLNPFHVTKEKF